MMQTTSPRVDHGERRRCDDLLPVRAVRRDANPEPSCSPPSIDDVWRRIDAEARLAHDRVLTRRSAPAAVRARVRSLAGVMAALLGVAVAIAVGAIALVSHGQGTPAGDTAGTQQLIAKLAVLRRPQTAADILPSDLHIRSRLSPPGTVIPQLTRLVRVLPDARLYLVVTTWSPDSTWSRRLGDQVSIVEISGGHAAQTVPSPAADLTNANEVFDLTPAGLGSPSQRGDYNVGIVPDGVARVRWTFPNRQNEPGAVLDVAVAENVAVTQARRDTGPLVLRAAWYAPDGQRVATSNRALLAAQAGRDAAQKAQAIRYDLQHASQADPSLLGAFTVFDITSRAAVKTAAGDLISRPPLSSVPLDILHGGLWHQSLFQLDPTQLREVITPSGVRLYVIPGGRALCLAAGSTQSPFPDGLLSGGGGGSCDLLAEVKSRGIRFSGGSLGVTRTYEIVPKDNPQYHRPHQPGITTIPVPDGIYVSPSRRTGR